MNPSDQAKRIKELAYSLQHLKCADAEQLCTDAGFSFRYVKINDKPQVVTRDVRTDRVEFVAYGGIITRCTVG